MQTSSERHRRRCRLAAAVGVAVWLAASTRPAHAVSLQIGSVSGMPGDTVQVPVTLSGGGGAVAGIQLDVLFETAQLSVSNAGAPCTAAAGVPLSSALPPNPPPPAGHDRVRLIVVDTGAMTTFPDGTLGTCSFTINSGATPATSPLQGQEQFISDPTGTLLASAVTDGAVVIEQPCVGCGCTATASTAGGTAALQQAGLAGSAIISLSAPTAGAPARAAPPSGTRWTVQVRNLADGRVVTGQVRVQGVPIGQAGTIGKVDWRVSGANVSGTVTTQAGATVAAFSGQITATGIRGTFSAGGGRTGSWAWEGTLPRSAAAPQPRVQSAP